MGMNFPSGYLVNHTNQREESCSYSPTDRCCAIPTSIVATNPESFQPDVQIVELENSADITLVSFPRRDRHLLD